MGTRADFYIGRTDQAEWLGSIAWDGYPDGNPAEVVEATTEDQFRAAVAVLMTREDGTTPDMGWPWPWKDSRLTDYVYAWDDGVWIDGIGDRWISRAQLDEFQQALNAAVEAGEEDPDWPDGPACTYPDMSARKAVTFGPRSGLIVGVVR